MSIRKERFSELWETYNWDYRQWDVHILEWYSETRELLKHLLYKSNYFYSKHLDIVCSKLDITRQTVNNRIKDWKMVFLRSWYYNKKELIKYLVHL